MCNAIFFVLMFATSTAIADWQEIIRGANSTGYAEPDSIDRRNDHTTMRVLIDYKKAPFDGNNLPYLSLTMQAEYSCAAKQFRVLTLTSHTDHMGRGKTPYTTDESSEWEPISSIAIQKALLEAACTSTVK